MPPVGKPVPPASLPGRAAVGRTRTTPSASCSPLTRCVGVVGIDRQRVEAHVERRLGEGAPAVGRLVDGVVAGRPDRGRRRARHRDHRAARDVGQRVVDLASRCCRSRSTSRGRRCCRRRRDRSGAPDRRRSSRGRRRSAVGRRTVGDRSAGVTLTQTPGGQVPAATQGSGGSGPASFPPAASGEAPFDEPQPPKGSSSADRNASCSESVTAIIVTGPRSEEIAPATPG